MPTLFLTGFPGFLGSALVERLLARLDAATSVTCLVQPTFKAAAAARVAALDAAHPGFGGRVHLVEGDITRADLGLGAERFAALQKAVQEIYHLAAVYDLGVSREVGLRVNVEGTRHLLRMAEGCASLRRFHYVSTCYVSGRYDGVFTEQDLVKGQRFNNFYEETKYLAEVEVQQALQQGLPVTIYRPGIVVGDSQTGVTQKYDGPYYLIRWILRWQHTAPMPLFGDPHRATVNLVPSDFVIDAIAYLSGLDASEGVVYQLADPQAPTVAEVLRLMAHSLQRRLFRIRLPLRLGVAALERVPRLAAWTGIEPQALPYFSHPTRYSSTNTQRDLEGSGVACPPLPSYLPTLIAFVKAHPEVSSGAMF